MTARALNDESILIETSQYSIHRIETPDHGHVIVKASRSPQPSRKEIAQLENEFRILKSLEKIGGVPRAVRLDVESHKAILVMQDFGGISLRHYADAKPLRLDDFFAIAKRIVTIVGDLHANNIVHCDLKPMNIIINSVTKDVQIIDFGCSRHLVGRGQFQLEGQGMTLAYIAPEQTGRVNRRIDHRTDFYSLGISFYELLAGKLPFNGRDALEWVHAHIAKKARNLHDLDHHITPAISQIVERLMNKAPEERYQTTEGLLHDIKKAEKLFSERRLWDSIELGERDRSTKILLSQKIVGREAEIARLNEQYLKSQTDGIRIATIHGEAGVGKSAFGREFRRRYADQISLFGFGKADPRQANFPFSTFSAVFEDLVRQILSAPEEVKGDFVTRLERKLEKGLGALLVIAPSLKELICSLEKADETTDSIGRLYTTIGTFFETMVEVFGQVVIQIDDAQFIDEASTKATEWLIESMGSLKILFVLLFRRTENFDASNLKMVLAAAEKHETRWIEFTLRDLKIDAITEYLKDTLQDDKTDFAELSELLLRKSSGNPFFLSQVLKSWIDDQLLFHDPYRGWTWDKNAIESKEIAKSVLDLLGTKIQALPKNIRYLFTMASCFPRTYSVNDLCELTGVEEDGIRKATAAVVDAGLVIPETDSSFRFAHEQIREAFYSLLNLESRRSLHAHVGLKLLTTIDPVPNSNEDLYLTAEHLNVGLSKVKDPAARRRIAELNLRVAHLAHGSSAFELGFKFAVAGLEAGDELKWSDDDQLLFKLQSLKGECEFLMGDVEAAEKTYAFVRVNAVSKIAQVRSALQLIRLYHSSRRMVEAMNEGLVALQGLGLRLERDPSQFRLGLRLIYAAWRLRGSRLRKIPVMDVSTPEGQFQALRHDLLMTIGLSAYYVDKKVALDIALTGTDLTLREGLTGGIATATQQIGIVLAAKFGWYRKAEKICVDTIDRIIDRVEPRAAFQIQANRQGFILPWIKPWSQVVKDFGDIRDRAAKAGEAPAAAFGSLYVPYYRMNLGHDVEESEQNRDDLEYLKKMDSNMYDCALPGYAFRAMMRGETASEFDFTHADFNEAEYVTRVNAAKSPNPKAWYDAHKMMSLFIFGHYAKAVDHFVGARSFTENVPFAVSNVMVRAFGVMICTENIRQGHKLSRPILKRVRLARRIIKRWATNNPLDVNPYHFLVEAEFATIGGDQLQAMSFYERAAEAALKTKSWMAAGLIYERAARFNIHYKRDRLARAFAEEAAYCFERWGAVAKVAQVRKLYGLSSTRAVTADDSHGSSSTDSKKLSVQIDLESLIKTTRALSSELNIDLLSVKLTEIMMESSGASRALLMLPESGQLTIKSQAGEQSDWYPEFIGAVYKSAEPLVIADSKQNELTKADPYFAPRKSISALAMPIIQKGEVLAVVYIENDSATNVFANQIEILNILAGQAGIALENARLYWEVSEKARMAGELKTAQAVQKTLFPHPQLKLDEVAVTGFYEPATECGGDWWFHHQNGDKLFVYIGDATGHGASAALVTSAARSAVSLMSMVADLTPQKAMEYLNRAIFETSKGTMNMTFFIGAFNLKSGVFEYCNASHEPPFWIKKSVSDLARASDAGEAEAFRDFKAGMGSLDEVHGPRLGEAQTSVFRQSHVQLSEDDLIVLFTDGVQDARNVERQEWGQRRFLKALQKATVQSHDVDDVVQKVVADNKSFTASTPLDDDIMVIAVKSRLRVS